MNISLISMAFLTTLFSPTFLLMYFLQRCSPLVAMLWATPVSFPLSTERSGTLSAPLMGDLMDIFGAPRSQTTTWIRNGVSVQQNVR